MAFLPSPSSSGESAADELRHSYNLRPHRVPRETYSDMHFSYVVSQTSASRVVDSRTLMAKTEQVVPRPLLKYAPGGYRELVTQASVQVSRMNSRHHGGEQSTSFTKN